MNTDLHAQVREFAALRTLADAYPSDREYTRTSPTGAVEVTAAGDGNVRAVRLHARWYELSEVPGLLHEIRAARQAITQCTVEDLVTTLREGHPGPGSPVAQSTGDTAQASDLASRLSALREIKAEKAQLRTLVARSEGTVSLASQHGWFAATVVGGVVTKLDFDAQGLRHKSIAAVEDDLTTLFDRAAAVAELSREEFEKSFPATYAELSSRGVV